MMKLKTVFSIICVFLTSGAYRIEGLPGVKPIASDSNDQSTLELLHVVGVI